MAYIERERCSYCGNETAYDKVYYCGSCGIMYCDACSKEKDSLTCPHCNSHLVEEAGFILPRARPKAGGETPST